MWAADQALQSGMHKIIHAHWWATVRDCIFYHPCVWVSVCCHGKTWLASQLPFSKYRTSQPVWSPLVSVERFCHCDERCNHKTLQVYWDQNEGLGWKIGVVQYVKMSMGIKARWSLVAPRLEFENHKSRGSRKGGESCLKQESNIRPIHTAYIKRVRFIWFA